MTLGDGAAIAQIVVAAMTTIGVLGSLYLSMRALREVHYDRKYRQCPHLAFETGGFRFPIEFKKVGTAIPGIDPKAAAKAFSELGAEAESVRLKDRTAQFRPIGMLKNYGLGPALHTHVTWIAEEVRIGDEQFKVDATKRAESRYHESFNKMPAWREHIPPGESTGITRLPTFIDKDCDRKVKEVRGVLRLTCQDVFGDRFSVDQEFYLMTGYGEQEPYVHITFKDIRPPAPAKKSRMWFASLLP
jgi:hypothetical protein